MIQVKIRYILITFLSLIQYSLATHPFEVIDEEIDGIATFAARTKQLLEEYKDQKIGFIFDVDGVITNRSCPDSEHDTYPRGDIVECIKTLDSLPNVKDAYSSAWDPVSESLERLSAVGLEDTLNLKEELKVASMQLGESTCDVVKIGKFAAIRRTSLKNGMKNDLDFYRQKAFALDVIYGPCSFDLVIVLEDSRTNLNNIKGTTKYAGDIIETSFYPTLKKLVLFQLPQINGEEIYADKIINMAVKSEPGSQSGYLADIDEPFSQFSQPFPQSYDWINLKLSSDQCGRESKEIEMGEERQGLINSQ